MAHQHRDSEHTQRNREHWDKTASSYNSADKQRQFGDLINKATAFVLNNITAIGLPFNDPSLTFEDPSQPQEQIRVLDYACGPGTITNILVGRATQFVGIDLSSNMVKEYNNRFAQPTESGQIVDATAYQGNLTSADQEDLSLSEPKFFDFDLVAVGFGFHHFEDLPTTTRRLAERLKPGGVLMILDFKPHAKEDMSNHDAQHTVAHHGFDEEKVRQLFEGAGLTDFKTVEMEEIVFLHNNAKRKTFMARAMKPNEAATGQKM